MVKSESNGPILASTLRHRVLTGWGWQTRVYSLRIGELVDCEFEIAAESEYSGGESLLATNDADEVEDWIVQRIEEMGE